MRSPEVWGPASPLAIAMEESERCGLDSMTRMLECYLIGRQYIVTPYRLPTHKLRARTLYGGKKGRAAIRRLKAMGLRPLEPNFGA